MRHRAIGMLALTLLACATPPPSPVPLEPVRGEPGPASSAASAPLPCERILRIRVQKSSRTLHAHCARGAIVEMTAALGREPIGDKLQAGDLRTPEGRYRISGPAGPSRFHSFVPIDYPSVADADRALAQGRIGGRDHARILEAHARGLEPPADTPLGGEIGLHGEGERWAGDSLDLDWTLGCIAVTDDDLDFLISRITPGVPVEIVP